MSLYHFYAFNNDKACPYEDLGCMFQHPKEVGKKDAMNDKIIDKEMHETQCHLCMVNLPTRDDLMDHYDLDHPELYTLMTSRSKTSR